MNHFPMADAHCDFLYYMVTEGCDIGTLTPPQVIYLPYLQRGGVAMQFFAVWIDTDMRVSYVQQCLNMIDAYYAMHERHPVLTPFTKGFDPASGKIATVLTIEGGEAIEGRIENLRNYYRLGVRAMSLTWNETNELAAPAMRRDNKGLTKLGRRVIREMCDIGMAVDVAHLSDAGIEDALEIATRPIFASHSNARAVCEHKRSLSDSLIKSIAGQGGVIGINFYHKQLCSGRPARISDIANHIMHVVEVGGIKSAAIGSDFNGMVIYPEDMPNSSALPNLAQELLDRGLTPEQVRLVTYENLANYIGQFYSE